jgi:hypothetical protein
MSEVATFFRHRENDPGETYDLQLDDAKGVCRVSVYSRKRMSSTSLRSRTLNGKSDRKAAFAQLGQDIGREGGGGWLVATIDEPGTRHLAVTAIPGPGGFNPPRQFVLLSPGRSATTLQTDDKGQKVPLASHVLVPVDEEADRILGDLLAYLAWLPPESRRQAEQGRGSVVWRPP